MLAGKTIVLRDFEVRVNDPAVVIDEGRFAQTASNVPGANPLSALLARALVGGIESARSQKFVTVLISATLGQSPVEASGTGSFKGRVSETDVMTVIESALGEVKREIEKQIAQVPEPGKEGATVATVSLSADPVTQSSSARFLVPGQILGDDFLQLRVPPNDGWIRIGPTSAAVNLARQGREPKESFAAQVVLFPIKSGSTSQELVSLIRSAAEKDTPSDRFTVIKSEFEATDKRGYPCVRHYGTYEDKRAMTGPSSSETLTLQVAALYCQHPKQDITGFAAIYSHRGAALLSTFESEAETFIEGVRAQKDAQPIVAVDAPPESGAAPLN